MEKKAIVCMTGFTEDPNFNQYKSKLKMLEFSYVEVLCQTTRILIVGCTATEKYKIAKLNKDPIECVTIEWLEDSFKKQKIMKTSQYKIPSIFYHVTIGIMGFNDQEVDKIIQLIVKNGGKIIIIPQTYDPQQQLQVNLIISSLKYLERLKLLNKKIVYPIVGIQWLELSLKNSICKYPIDYALNSNLQQQNKSINIIYKLNQKLLELLRINFMDCNNNFLDNTIIYLSDTIDNKFISIIKKIICCCGGLYLNTINPIITHIIVGNISQEQYNSLKKYGNLTHIIHLGWLIDSVLLYHRMQQQDYYIRNFKHSQQYYSNIRNDSDDKSNNNSLLLLNMKSRQSISIPYKKQKQKLKTKIQSNLFLNLNFYVDISQRKQMDISKTISKIRKNAGNVYDSLSSSLKEVYIILKDSQNNQKIMKKLENFKLIKKVVSLRWVTYCLSRSELINYNKPNYYIFKPFKFHTPIKNFHKYKFEIICINDLNRKQLQQLLIIFGSKLNSNISQLTHCLCDQQYYSSQRLKQIIKQNLEIKLIKIQWIFSCIIAQKIISTEEYQINYQINKNNSKNQQLTAIKNINHNSSNANIQQQQQQQQL